MEGADTASKTCSWEVHKFGGTSVGNADCMRNCIRIIAPLTKKSRIAVVVSAIGGKPKTTDLLLDSVNAAAAGDLEGVNICISKIHSKHFICIGDILKGCPDVAAQILAKIDRDLNDVRDILKAVVLMKSAHEQILELVSGYGEVWSAQILAAAMVQQGLPFTFVNARDVLIISENDVMGVQVHWNDCENRLQALIEKADSDVSKRKSNEMVTSEGSIQQSHLLITGYIASSAEGVATTLKRDGSDFSASIFGKLLKADCITIWTDVSGVYSADPRRVKDARVIPEVSYTEAIELAYFGAKVIHPKTMSPAITAGIPIYIRNSFQPTHRGTRIYHPTARDSSAKEKCVCGFSSIDNIALMNIEGTGMVGVPGIAHRLFGALKAADISVIFIAQASSEHSICFATQETNKQSAYAAVEEAFFYELKQKYITKITVIDNCSIIAAVGESMTQMPGVAGIFFGALGNARINVLAISQGCDERNISAVVNQRDSARALQAVHSAFWFSSHKMSIGVIGTGRVGSAVIQTLLEQSAYFEERFEMKLLLRGIMNSEKMMLDEDLSLDLRSKLKVFVNQSKPTNALSKPLKMVRVFRCCRTGITCFIPGW